MDWLSFQMPHLNKVNATLRDIQSVAFHLPRCGIYLIQVWHQETINPELTSKRQPRVSKLFRNRFLCNQCATDQECCSQSNNSVKFREYSEDQRVAEYIVTLSDSCNTIRTNLSLADSWEQSNQSQRDTCTEDSGSLDSSHLRSKDTKNSLEHKVTGKTIQTLCTGKCGQYEEVTECTVVLL